MIEEYRWATKAKTVDNPYTAGGLGQIGVGGWTLQSSWEGMGNSTSDGGCGEARGPSLLKIIGKCWSN